MKVSPQETSRSGDSGGCGLIGTASFLGTRNFNDLVPRKDMTMTICEKETEKLDRAVIKKVILKLKSLGDAERLLEKFENSLSRSRVISRDEFHRLCGEVDAELNI